MTFAEFFNNLPWEAIKITLGIFICCFGRQSIKGATMMAELGTYWLLPMAFFSIWWGIFMVVYNVMTFIERIA